MHSYSSEDSREHSREHIQVPFVIATLSIAIFSLVKGLAEFATLNLNYYIAIPSAFAIYGLTYKWFDKTGWKISIFRKLRIISTPDISGKWYGKLTSSNDEYKHEYCMDLTIDQTWKNIMIYTETDDSYGISISALISQLSENRWILNRLYRAQKKPKHSDSDFMHHGTWQLMLVVSTDGIGCELEGQYYTDRSGQRYGSLKFSRNKISATEQTAIVNTFQPENTAEC